MAFLISVSIAIYPAVSSALLKDVFNPVYSKLFQIFVYCIPVFCAARTVTSDDVSFIKNNFLKFSIVVVLFGICSYAVSVVKGIKIEYMTFSYNLLLGSLTCVDRFLFRKKKNFALFFFGLVGLSIILVSGARGAVLSSIGYFALLPFRVKRNKRLVLFFSVVITVLIIIVGYRDILSIILNAAKSMGISRMHSLDALISGTLFESDGRQERFNSAITGLYDNPIGYGLFGDWYCINKYLGINSYMHNIVLEFLCDFGIFFGPLFIVFLFILFVKAFKTANGWLVHILLPIGCFQLMFSGSFLFEIAFYILVGLSLKMTEKRKVIYESFTYCTKCPL